MGVDAEITDNAARHRYELHVDGITAFVSYRRGSGEITFVHTEVPDALDGLKVVPLCPFIAAFMERHPEYDDLRTPATGRRG